MGRANPVHRLWEREWCGSSGKQTVVPQNNSHRTQLFHFCMSLLKVQRRSCTSVRRTIMHNSLLVPNSDFKTCGSLRHPGQAPSDHAACPLCRLGAAVSTPGPQGRRPWGCEGPSERPDPGTPRGLLGASPGHINLLSDPFLSGVLVPSTFSEPGAASEAWDLPPPRGHLRTCLVLFRARSPLDPRSVRSSSPYAAAVQLDRRDFPDGRRSRRAPRVRSPARITHGRARLHVPGRLPTSGPSVPARAFPVPRLVLPRELRRARVYAHRNLRVSPLSGPTPE